MKRIAINKDFPGASAGTTKELPDDVAAVLIAEGWGKEVSEKESTAKEDAEAKVRADKTDKEAANSQTK